MRYNNIFHQAYTLTIHNPLMWLFGLVMLGGFNLSLINFFALAPDSQWNTWPIPLSALLGSDFFSMALMFLGALASFLILNLVKLSFIAVAHKLVHKPEERKCRLCVHEKNKTTPYFLLWFRLVLASLTTIILTVCLSLPINILLEQNVYGNSTAIIINVAFLAIVTCALGTWNVFVGYFIVWHGLGFKSAARAAFGLLINRFRQVLEFVVILSVIYTISVLVGNAFINVWHHGFAGAEFIGLRPLALLVFVLWLAVNNTYFNMAFMLFFDNAVRSTSIPDEAEAVVPTL